MKSRPFPPIVPELRPSRDGYPRVHPGSIPALTLTTTIDLDLTDACNLACSYCFKSLGRPNNMSLDTAKDAIEWLIMASKSSREIYVNFMGGEPTLRFTTMKEIVRWGTRRARSAQKTVRFSFTSNMTAWTDEIRDWVDRLNVGVLMSIDGLAEVQDSQRPAKDGKPKAEIVAHWARSMLRTRPQSDARLTISPAWVHKLYESLVYLWEEIGFRNIVMADADYGKWTDEHFAVYREQNEQIADYLFWDFVHGGGKAIAVYSYFIKHLIDRRQRGEPETRRRFPCGAGYNYSMIDYQGDIWPCHRFDGAAEDNSLETTFRLANIYRNGYNEQLSNAFRSFDHFVISKPECAACPLDAICGGFCPAANLQHSKSTIYLPHSDYCRLKQTLFPILERLYVRMNQHDPERLREHVDTMGIGMVEV